MAEYNIDYTEPENERDNPHNVGLENLDAIIYSGKPSAVQAVTWEGLGRLKHNIMTEAELHPFFPFSEPELLSCEWLVVKGLLSESDGEYLITEAGRALLPKAEALFQVGKSMVEKTTLRADLEAIAHEATGDYTPAGIATWALTKLDVLQTELAAANERAEAAEVEAQRLQDVLIDALAFARTSLIPDNFESYVLDGDTRLLHWNEHMRIEIAKLIDAALK